MQPVSREQKLEDESTVPRTQLAWPSTMPRAQSPGPASRTMGWSKKLGMAHSDGSRCFGSTCSASRGKGQIQVPLFRQRLFRIPGKVPNREFRPGHSRRERREITNRGSGISTCWCHARCKGGNHRTWPMTDCPPAARSQQFGARHLGGWSSHVALGGGACVRTASMQPLGRVCEEEVMDDLTRKPDGQLDYHRPRRLS